MDKDYIIIGAIFLGYFLILLFGKYAKAKTEYTDEAKRQLDRYIKLYLFVSGYWFVIFYLIK
tara:strand:- start:1108 stop:1293 length:186 start_codon:yes stop_codon:yes gene_type:complete